MYPNREYSTADGGLQTIFTVGLGSVDLDENTDYWLMLSSVNSTPTIYWRWYYDLSGPSTNVETATAAPGTSSSTDGGTGWTMSRDKVMVFTQTRFKAEPYNCLDVLGVRKRLLIESVIPSFPQQIVTKQGAAKYILGFIQETARPRRVFDFPDLTVPNKPINAGDTAIIVDPRFNFSTPGHAVVYGQITDMRHSFGIKNGGLSTASIGQTNTSLSVVQYPQSY
jgi:hypothetical protein